MSRNLDTATLDVAARDYAGQFLLPTVASPVSPTFAPIGGRGWVLNSMEHFHFEDEFNYVRQEMRQYLGPKALKEFDDEAAKTFTPYDDGELAAELASRLAVTPDGKPIPGQLGSVKTGGFLLGWTIDSAGRTVLAHGDVHIGETMEEAKDRCEKALADSGTTFFPLGAHPGTMALNTRISNGPALTMCNAMVDSLDLGGGTAIVRGYSGAQPTDPDTAASGTVLFTLTCNATAFGNAADIAPGARATANAIVSDTSADTTGTLGYCRGWTTADGSTPVTAKIDGEAGTGTADFVFNTLAIVGGATVALSSWTITVPES